MASGLSLFFSCYQLPVVSQSLGRLQDLGQQQPHLHT
uniref:Uncharacterized protein n=1 Tax=Anguilla anguilla TaxID=7936 RepID=A0A0E9Q4S3_ANGAN